MWKYAKICSDPISISPMHSYAFICTKYANICKICKHENYMQHMQKYALPTFKLLMEWGLSWVSSGLEITWSTRMSSQRRLRSPWPILTFRVATNLKKLSSADGGADGLRRPGCSVKFLSAQFWPSFQGHGSSVSGTIYDSRRGILSLENPGLGKQLPGHVSDYPIDALATQPKVPNINLRCQEALHWLKG